MGVITFQSELASPVPAAGLFTTLFLESEHLPKIIPQFLKSIEIVQGDGGPGSIKKLTFVEEGKGTFVVKQKIEEVDKVNLKTSFTWFEGYSSSDKVDQISFKNNVDKISFNLSFVPSLDGGSIVKSTTKVYTKVDFEFSEEHFLGKAKAYLKGVGEYLQAQHLARN